MPVVHFTCCKKKSHDMRVKMMSFEIKLCKKNYLKSQIKLIETMFRITC